MFKKNFTLLFAIAMIYAMAFATVDGLTVGAGLAIYDFDAEDVSKDMMAGFYGAYETSFMDEAFEIDLEVGLSRFYLDDKTNIVDIEIEATYNIEFDVASRLSFILNSYTLLPFHDDLDVTSYLTPGVKLRQTLGFGDIYFKVDVPFNLVNADYSNVHDTFDFVGLDFTFSIFNERKTNYRGNVHKFPNGFGGELKMCNVLNHPDDETGFVDYLHITPFYTKDFIYVEAEVCIPLQKNGIDTEGLTVTPKIEMDAPINGLGVWFEFPISQIGADKDLTGKTIFGTFFGVSYNF